MNLTELEEFQGLTADMVRGWLLAQGWELTDTSNGNTDAKKRFTDRFTVLGCQWKTCLEWLLIRVAAVHGLNMQTLLREINPRMRKGVPSKAALRAHRGLWLRSIGTETIATVLSRLIDEFPSPRDNESYFWPCDANGNKVRWPVDAEGKML